MLFHRSLRLSVEVIHGFGPPVASDVPPLRSEVNSAAKRPGTLVNAGRWVHSINSPDGGGRHVVQHSSCDSSMTHQISSEVAA